MLPFNATIIHVNLPTPEILEEATVHFTWKHDFHSIFLPFMHHHADEEMSRIIDYAGDKVSLFTELKKYL